MQTNIFVYWSDGLGSWHLTIILGMGAALFPTQTACWAGHLTNVFKFPRIARGEGMFAAGIDSHITIAF